MNRFLGAWLAVSNTKTDTELLVREKIALCINANTDEVSARSIAVELGQAYLNADEEGKKKTLMIIAKEFGTDQVEIKEKIYNYEKMQDQAAAQELVMALRPKNMILLKKFISLPEGLKFIIDLRAKVLQYRSDDRDLLALAENLREVLLPWFDVAILDLYSITWDSPASLLEKLIKYEAVHAINSWNDLRNRLDSDRCCFAFFHHKMPNEPLIFVEVALVNEVAASIQQLLDEGAPQGDPKQAGVAIFYSISNTQRGLAGISLGNFLIKKVVEELRGRFLKIKVFATLSPIPGFVKWLKKLKITSIKLSSDLSSLQKKVEQLAATPEDQILGILKDIKEDLFKLCAYYLIKEKENNRALDPVARFHLSNGASVYRINAVADVSPKGLRESAGMMVNYLYEPEEIEGNYYSYQASGKVNYNKKLIRF